MVGKIITIAQQKGGSGKTTIAAHLAIALSRLMGHSVAILDTDPQGSLGRWFLARNETNGEVPESELGFQTASAWGAPYEAKKLATIYDYVIIDTPPKISIEGRNVFNSADLVIVPVTPSPVDLWATGPTIELALGEEKTTILVLNRANIRTQVTRDTISTLQNLNAITAKTIVGNRVIFASSMGTGNTVLETNPGGFAAREIIELTIEIVKHCKAQSSSDQQENFVTNTWSRSNNNS